MQQSALAQTLRDRPVLELACSTWIGFEQLYRNHILQRRMILPPTAVGMTGPVVVTVRLPSRDVLMFDATATRVFHDNAGVALGVEIIFQKLTVREMKAISRHAAHKERGWEVPRSPHVLQEDEGPKSGLRIPETE